jgi:hypothetical protein
LLALDPAMIGERFPLHRKNALLCLIFGVLETLK